VVYSEFVEENVMDQLNVFKLPKTPVRIIQPAVDMIPFNQSKDKSSIISVGRFFVGAHCKKQDAMIKAFRRLIDSGSKAELHLVGSLLPESNHRAYFLECERLAEGIPVHFHVDASSEVVAELYEQASIYWHASGFGVDAQSNPSQCEHFGISPIEAMSAGVIPIVVRNGGPAITVTHGLNGFCYDTEAQLVELTKRLLVESDEVIIGMRSEARIRAADFSKDRFVARWNSLLHEITEAP
jgi:glycosyltransferase involved in cell wall biosynthesis